MSIVLHNHDGSVDRSFIYLRTSTYAFDVMIWTKAEIETETVFCLNWKKKSKNIAKSRTNFVVDIRRPSYWVRGVVTFIFINSVQNVLNNSIKKFEEIYNRFFLKVLKSNSFRKMLNGISQWCSPLIATHSHLSWPGIWRKSHDYLSQKFMQKKWNLCVCESKK